METTNEYNFSIFKPVNEYSRRNRNIILSIILIWAVCVFGFQFLLLIVEKPTPEPAYISYQAVADRVIQGTATLEEKQVFAGSLLMVLGKTIKPDARKLLDRALTLTVYDLLQDSLSRDALMTRLIPLSEKRAALSVLKAGYDAGEIRYVEYKNGSLELNNQIVALKNELGHFLSQVSSKLIPPGDPFAHVKEIWLPYELTAGSILDPLPVNKAELDQIMKLYLIHNQSFITDFPFLGFPFHYFYTAVFLLVLFVVLCIVYAVRIQQLHKKFGMEE